jgi:undecaprenyl-diphosphatase
MNWWQAFILGIVEGITEYLPVSSTGHLLVTQRLLGIGATTASEAFAICIQAGAIVAVLGLYRNRVRQMCRGLLGKDPAGLRLAIAVLAAFIPAVIAGLSLGDLIKENLFGGNEAGLWPIVFAWFVGGIAILATAKYRSKRKEDNRPRHDLEHLTWKMALVIGLCQCVALWPGTSRSLVTIVGGILVGLRMASAVEFSFILGFVTLSAATAYDAMKHGGEMLDAYGFFPLLIGFLSAWISAVLAVKWMVSYLQKHGLSVFGWYRIAIAIVIGFCILWGLTTA